MWVNLEFILNHLFRHICTSNNFKCHPFSIVRDCLETEIGIVKLKLVSKIKCKSTTSTYEDKPIPNEPRLSETIFFSILNIFLTTISYLGMLFHNSLYLYYKSFEMATSIFEKFILFKSNHKTCKMKNQLEIESILPNGNKYK